MIQKKATAFILPFLVGIFCSCDYFPPTLVCINIGNSTDDFAQADQKSLPNAVYVANGSIVKFDFRFNRPGRLESVSFTNLGILYFMDSSIFLKCTSLKRLILSGNSLIDIPKLPKSLKFLDLRRNRLQTTIPESFVRGHPVPGYIKRYFQTLKDTHLEDLNLSHNFIEYFLFDDIEGSPANTLRRLNLSNNPLRVLDLRATKFLFLNLSYTLMDAMDLDMDALRFYKEFYGSPPNKTDRSSRFIDLSYANYKTLNNGFLGKLIAFSAGTDLAVNFTGNPWSCSCYMKEARRTLLALKGSDLEVDWFNDLLCSTPVHLYGRLLVDVDEDDLKCDENVQFADCCWSIRLERNERRTVPCSLTGLPQPDARCTTSDKVGIYAKTTMRAQNSLDLTFKSMFSDSRLRNVSYTCTAYQYSSSGMVKATNETFLCAYQSPKEGGKSVHDSTSSGTIRPSIVVSVLISLVPSLYCSLSC